MKSLRHSVVLATLVFVCCGSAARADSDGWVLFAQANIHPTSVPMLRVNEFGKIFQQSYFFTDGDFLLGSWAHGLIGYDRASNFTCAFQVTEDGGRTQSIPCVRGFDTLASVTKLVPFGEFLFGYDGGSHGQIVQYSIDLAHGYIVSATTDTLGLSAWTHIFATKNYIFFYNKPSGVYAIGTITDTGHFVQYSNGTIAAGYGVFAKVGDTLVAYNGRNGKYEVDAINFKPGSGTFSVTLAKQSNGVFDKGYSTVAALGNALVWYSKATGATLVGYLDRGSSTVGKWVQTSKFTGASGYGYVGTAGNSIVLYNTTNGAAAAATVSPAGALVVTDSTTVGAGYTDIGVTTR